MKAIKHIPGKAVIDKELGDRYEDDSGDKTHNQAGDCPVEQPPHSYRQDPECY